MNTESHDHDVDEYLDGNTGLSKLYSTSKDLKSPAHLNSAIEQLARESLKAKPGKAGTGRVWKWPLALAASVILGVMVGLFYRASLHKPASKQLATRDTTSAPALVPTPKTSERKQQQSSQPAKSPVNITPAPSVVKKPMPARQSIAQQQEQENVPPKLQELLQQTSAGDTALTSMLPDKVLKTWTRKQWQEQVSKLKSLHRDQLAEKYIKAYPKYFPGETLTVDTPAK